MTKVYSTNRFFMGRPGEAIIDHETGRIVGVCGSQGQIHKDDIRENYARALIGRMTAQYPEGFETRIYVTNKVDGHYIAGPLVELSNGTETRIEVSKYYEDSTDEFCAAMFYVPPGTYTLTATLAPYPPASKVIQIKAPATMEQISSFSIEIDDTPPGGED